MFLYSFKTGFVGVQIGSHINDWNLDAPELYPVWKVSEYIGWYQLPVPHRLYCSLPLASGSGATLNVGKWTKSCLVFTLICVLC